MGVILFMASHTGMSVFTRTEERTTWRQLQRESLLFIEIAIVSSLAKERLSLVCHCLLVIQAHTYTQSKFGNILALHSLLAYIQNRFPIIGAIDAIHSITAVENISRTNRQL